MELVDVDEAAQASGQAMSNVVAARAALGLAQEALTAAERVAGEKAAEFRRRCDDYVAIIAAGT